MSYYSSYTRRPRARRNDTGNVPKNAAHDLYSLLEIIHPTRGYVTCAGIAPSKGRRCQWELDIADVEEVEERLRKLSERVPFVLPTSEELRPIARLALCRK